MTSTRRCSPTSVAVGVLTRLPPGRLTRRLLRLVATGLGRLGADVLVERTWTDGTRFVIDTRSRTESGALWDGGYEADELAFLLACLDPGAVVLDIGANVGLITVPLARRLVELGGPARVVAVEPVPVNADRLRRHVEINGLSAIVDVVELALGRTDGTAEMVKEGPSGSSDNAMVALERSQDPARRRVTVELSTADRVADERGVTGVGLVKIDVEGFEFDVLAGAGGLLARDRPIVYGEFHNELMPRRGHDFSDVWELFEPLGYVCFRFAGRCVVERVPSPPPDIGNVALVPTERVEDLRRRMLGVGGAMRGVDESR